MRHAETDIRGQKQISNNKINTFFSTHGSASLSNWSTATSYNKLQWIGSLPHPHHHHHHHVNTSCRVHWVVRIRLTSICHHFWEYERRTEITWRSNSSRFLLNTTPSERSSLWFAYIISDMFEKQEGCDAGSHHSLENVWKPGSWRTVIKALLESDLSHFLLHHTRLTSLAA